MVRFSFAKCSWRPRKVTSVARRVWAEIFFSDYFRIGVGSRRPSLHCALRFCRFWQNSVGFCRIIFRGKRSFWWCWMVTRVAPPIVKDVSYVRSINHESLRGRDNVWWCCRVTADALRILLGVSCVGNVKPECRRCSLLCIPEVARRNVLVVSFMCTLRPSNKLVGVCTLQYSEMFCCTL